MKQFRTGRRVTRAGLLVAFFVCALLAPASAQVTTGSLQGVVLDPNKAVVAGATVRITNTETGISREAQTNDEGFYRVSNLLPGQQYKIEVIASGFEPTTLEPVRVLLGTENSADVTVGLARVGEEVIVTTDQQLIDSTQSQTSTSYSTQQLTQLPYNGLIDNLALLTPGVVTPGDADFTNGVGISANGNRARSNNFQIDGQDNNDLSIGGPNTFITNAEAIGELQVVTNTFSAEFGRNSGAQINVITRPGTNEFHGAIFEFHQNSALNARDNLEKQAAGTFDFLADNGFTEFAGFAERNGKDPSRENRFGGRIGGPIIKNKAFFFATYEGDYFRGELTTESLGGGAVTPTLESTQFLAARFPNPATAQFGSTGFGGGPAAVQNFGQFLIAPPSVDTDGNGIPDTFLFGPGNPFGLPVTPGFLAPLAVTTTAPGAATRRTIFGGEAVRLVKSDATNHQFITRVDYNLTDRDSLVARYLFSDSDFPFVISRILAGSPISVPSRSHNLGVTYTRTLSSTLVNEARVNYQKSTVLFGDPTTEGSGGVFLPEIDIAGNGDLFGNAVLDSGTDAASFPQGREIKVYQVQDIVSATLGNHGLKFGFDINRNTDDDFFLPNFVGAFTFNGGTTAASAGVLPAGTFFTFGTNGANGASRTGQLATGFENFLLNRPRDIDFALGAERRKIVQNNFFFFLQDDWRVRPNLTLNLGLRYEVSTQPLNPLIDALNERESNPDTALFDPSFPLSSRTLDNVPVDKNNFGPRVGFAYSPNLNFLGDRFRDGRTVIRGAFGIAYDPGFFNIVNNTVTGAPFSGVGRIRQNLTGTNLVRFPTLPANRADLNGTPGTAGGNPLLFDQIRVDPGFYNPYTMSFNFGVQQELHRNGVLEVRYVGNRIVGQFQTVNTNPRLDFLNDAAAFLGLPRGAFTSGFIGGSNPGTNGNGRLDANQGFTFTVTNGATSTYHGLQMRYDTRFGNDFVLNANYTLSKAIDNTSEIFSTLGGGQTISISQNPFDISRGERGLSAFHQKHNFTASFLYELPFFRSQQGFVGKLLGGYQLNGIIRMGSGRPYSPAEVFGTYDPRFPSLRPFNGNPSAPEGTIAFGAFADLVINNGAGGAELGEDQFVLYDTRRSGSQGRVVTRQEALSQARLIYNDFGLVPALGSSTFLPFLEAFNFFGTPYGDVGRNTFSGLPFYSVNMSVFKTTNLTENVKLELRAEAFNLLNRRNFGVPDPVTEDAFFGFTTGSFQNPGFNNGSQRTVQVGFRLLF